MPATIVEFDWGSTPLGPKSTWSPALLTTFDIMQSAHFAMCAMWGPARTLLYNEAYIPFLADRHPQALGQPIDQVWYDVWGDILPLINRAMTGEAVHFEDMPLKMVRRGCEEETFWTFSYSPLREGDTVVGFLNIAFETTERVNQDRLRRQTEAKLREAISERDHREEELRESEAQLRRAQEAGGIGLFCVDLASDLITTTPEFCRLFGLADQPTYPTTVLEEQVVVEDRALASTVQSRRSGDAAPDVEYRIRCQDTGDLRWIGRIGRMECDEAGAPVRFVGAVRDVTDRRIAEERNRLALEAGAILGTWNWDVPANRFTVDEAFARTFGIDPTLGRTGLSLDQVVATVHPDDQTGLSAAIEEALRHGGHYVHQYRVLQADGEFHWIEANGRVELSPDGAPLTFPGVVLDVEERRAVESERDRAWQELRDLNGTLEQRVYQRTADLMKAEEQLRQSQKMEAVGQLTGGLAHDFNNLLAGISGSLELMGIRLGQGRLNDLQKYMSAAQDAAKRAAALTHRLLAFSRRQTLAPKPTDINGLVRGMMDLTRRTVGPSVDINTVLAVDLWTAQVDAGQLENAVLNLCINARDAMPDGGRIVIESSNKFLDEVGVAGRDFAPGEYLVLSVTDTGSGMSPEVAAQAFDPFFTTKPIGEGTGLGLSMIYGFAKQSGGQVRIHSTVGIGTTVSIFLPRYHGVAQENLPEPIDRLGRLASDGETVLIVDDEASVRMLVGEVLKDLGYACVEAADGVAGLNVLQSDARVDLLITDVGLPGGLNGRQLADAARLSRMALKVLFITGYAESMVVRNGQLDPGMRVLTKPFTVADLSSRVRELLGSAEHTVQNEQV